MLGVLLYNMKWRANKTKIYDVVLSATVFTFLEVVVVNLMLAVMVAVFVIMIPAVVAAVFAFVPAVATVEVIDVVPAYLTSINGVFVHVIVAAVASLGSLLLPLQ
ncbi:hypothetical protein NDU88_002774 [Pleurodeles waltl]|uniref:Uncharacterized protein n=1 Tax=Pleurodeles waltl TaxID=8319 RepID=A0AAV7T4L0_PLEWA|nr:hypothetical protein NDU88_002774 [Pleurodeles waltl]